MAEEEKAQVQQDIDKLDAKIEELQQDGSDLYAAAITALTDERDELGIPRTSGGDPICLTFIYEWLLYSPHERG